MFENIYNISRAGGGVERERPGKLGGNEKTSKTWFFIEVKKDQKTWFSSTFMSKAWSPIYNISRARGGWIRERFEVLLTSFSEEFSNIKHQLLDMKWWWCPGRLQSKSVQKEAKAEKKLWVQGTYNFSGRNKAEKIDSVKNFWKAEFWTGGPGPRLPWSSSFASALTRGKWGEMRGSTEPGSGYVELARSGFRNSVIP